MGNGWRIDSNHIAVTKIVIADAGTLMRPLAGDQHSAVRDTNGRCAAAIIEPGSLTGQSFHIGCNHLRHLGERQTAPAMFVAEHKDNIWPFSRGDQIFGLPQSNRSSHRDRGGAGLQELPPVDSPPGIIWSRSLFLVRHAF